MLIFFEEAVHEFYSSDLENQEELRDALFNTRI